MGLTQELITYGHKNGPRSLHKHLSLCTAPGCQGDTDVGVLVVSCKLGWVGLQEQGSPSEGSFCRYSRWQHHMNSPLFSSQILHISSPVYDDMALLWQLLTAELKSPIF